MMLGPWRIRKMERSLAVMKVVMMIASEAARTAETVWRREELSWGLGDIIEAHLYVPPPRLGDLDMALPVIKLNGEFDSVIVLR
jgi:hypothetical protein